MAPLAAQFDEMVNEQARDWSDLFFELDLPDQRTLDAARLSMAPVQFERVAGSTSLFVFRVSQSRGYGVPAPLTQACLAKLDEQGIEGELTLDRVLHQVRPNYTQGPA